MCKRIMTADAFTADGRQYKTCNDCRLKMKIRKATQKDERKPLNPMLVDPPKPRKPKGPHGTSPRAEYNRQYWQEHKDEMKAKRCKATGEAIAVTTDMRIVMLFEKGYSPNDIASRCMVSVERVKHVIEREGCRAGEARLCCDCWLYPCFDGMDSISTNLALTCQKYHRKEAAS